MSAETSLTPRHNPPTNVGGLWIWPNAATGWIPKDHYDPAIHGELFVPRPLADEELQSQIDSAGNRIDSLRDLLDKETRDLRVLIAERESRSRANSVPYWNMNSDEWVWYELLGYDQEINNGTAYLKKSTFDRLAGYDREGANWKSYKKRAAAIAALHLAETPS